MCSLIFKTQGNPCVGFRASFTVWFPLLWYSAQQVSAASTFQTSRMFWLPSSDPCSVPLFGKYFQVESWVGITGLTFCDTFFSGNLSNAAYCKMSEKRWFQVFCLFFYLFTTGEQVLYQVLLWPEVEVLDTCYVSSHLIPTNSARCQLSPFYRIGFFRSTNVPKVRQLVSIKEGEQVLVLWLMTCLEKA